LRIQTRIQNTFGFFTPEDGTDTRKPEIRLVRSVRPVNYCGIDYPLLTVCSLAWLIGDLTRYTGVRPSEHDGVPRE
jgi:hypothetical protein